MRSHLTRDVFRRILANEPITHRRCLHQLSHRSLAPASPSLPFVASRHARTPLARRPQRRGLGGFNFNIFNNRQQEKEADLAPGIDKMMELAKKERMKARLPPSDEVVLAFQQLFASKARRFRNLTDTEAQLALQSLRYILSSAESQTPSIEHLLSSKTIWQFGRVLRLAFPAQSATHIELARLIYDTANSSPETHEFLLITYITLLCRSGETSLARDLVLQHEGNLDPSSKWHMADSPDQTDAQDATEDTGATNAAAPSNPKGSQAWRCLLDGFVREGKAGEVMEAVARLEKSRDAASAAHTAMTMIDFSLQAHDVDALMKWWLVAKQHAGGPVLKARWAGKKLREVLAWCRENNHVDVGHDIVRDLVQSEPRKMFWDEIFVWAAATGKGADEIDRMMVVMEESNLRRDRRALVDHDTINALVEFAVSKGDPYLAERFIALGRDRNIHPDARTFVLQMEYRLKVNDTDGALVAYKNLQSQDTSSRRDVPAVNGLIVALCGSSRHDFETIMNVAADLSDRRARFEADTVSALSILHLTRDERDDVIDLLNTHAFHYSSSERGSIRNRILEFCLDPAIPTARAWMAYQVLVDIFDELARPERVQAMSAFFERGRPDMAVHVFQDMRRHSREDTMADIDAYVAAFMGLAKARELEGVEVVHNQLKLDYNIDATTHLYNSLMIAYSACGKARNALVFWEEIVASREGPTYNSIHAALRACEKDAWGDVRAKKIWELLEKRKVDLDAALWASYAAALAGNGDVALAMSTLEEAEAKGEVEVDWFILGSLHYVVAGNDAKQAEVEAFAKERYAEEWERLERVGMEEQAYGVKRFKIDRKIGP